jgi:hypothetical protein
MNKAILQIWEESNKEFGIRQDGCSIHIDSIELNQYIDSVYRDRDGDNLPISYERVVGNPTEVEICDLLYNRLTRDKSIRLRSYEMNNLLRMEEIIVND